MNDDLTKLQEENYRLKTAVRELAVLNEISGMINSTMTIEEISARIMKKVVQALDAEEAAVHTFSEDADNLVPVTFVRGKLDSSSQLKSRFDVRLTGWIARHKKPLLINDVASDEKFKSLISQEKPIRSLLTVPLSAKGKLIGSLSVFNSRKPEHFEKHDIRLLTIIGAQAAQIIENARLYHEELRLHQVEGELRAGKKIQEGFLPDSIPKIEGYDIFGGSIAAKEVGGDYYDFIENEKRLYFTLGDVSGKGLPAALLMSTIQAQTRLLVQRQPDIGPDEILTELNRITWQLSDSAQFATMVVGCIDFETDAISIANGGHNYPIIVRRDKSLEEITEQSLLIGAIEEVQYSIGKVSLSSGDMLVISSDGIDEAWDTEENDFSLERLYSIAKANNDRSASELYHLILNEIASHRGDANQSDDITLAIFKKT